MSKPDEQTQLDAAGNTGANVQKFALNGAQVTALVQIVTSVATGLLPRQAGVEMISAAFPFIDDAWANSIMDKAGKGFKPAEPIKKDPRIPNVPKGV